MTLTCPELERMAAYLDDLLDERERGDVEAHVSTCPECYALVAEAVHTQLNLREPGAAEAPPPTRVPRASPPVFRWVLATAAAAALVLVGVRLLPPTGLRSPNQALADALGERRLVEPRLTGGFRFARLRAVRSGEARADPELWALYSAAASIEGKARNADASPDLLGAAGVARLLLGGTSDAVATLEQATQRSPQDARLWSDLSAAYLVRAKDLRQATDWPRALQAADQAVALDAALPEGHFNRALCLESLALRDQAREAWERYLSLDGSSGWAKEARQHIRALEDPDGAGGMSDRGDSTLELKAALDAQSDAALQAAVARSPLEARAYFGEVVLGQWADACMAGEEGGEALSRAVRLGRALMRDDPLVRDTLQSVEAASDGGQDLSLARGHAAYAQGKALSNRGRPQEAQVHLQVARAQLDRARSPFVLLTELNLAIVLRSSDPVVAEKMLQGLAERARERGYPWLLGRSLWMLGLLRISDGRLGAALADYQAALTAFGAAADPDGVTAMHGLIAEGSDLLGDESKGWSHRTLALQGLDRLSGQRRHVLLLDATWASFQQALPRAALDFADRLSVSDQHWGDPAGLAEGLRLRALIHDRLGDHRQAGADLADARRWLERSPADALRRGEYLAEASAVEGELQSRAEPAAAVPALDHAVRAFQERRRSGRLPHLFLFRGRALAALGRYEEAERDFMDGIRLFEEGRPTLDDEHQIPFFDQSWDLFDEVIALLVGRGEVEKALALAERARARQLLEALAGPNAGPEARPDERAPVRPLTPAQLRAALPDGVTLLYYVVLSDRLLNWVLTDDRCEFFETPLPAARLRTMIGEYRTLLERPPSETDRARVDELAAGIGEVLVGPWVGSVEPGTALVVIPDDILQRLPFGAIRDPRTGRYLVEDRRVDVAPSGSVFVRASLPRAAQREPSALVVGNPTIELDGAPPGADLPGAEAEAAEVASLYPGSELLTGPMATRARFLQRLGRHEVVHFAGHAVSNSQVHSLARLLLAPEPGVAGSGDLFLHAVPQAQLRRVCLIVLAACSTGAGPLSRSEGVLSLARPLLARGVTAVVASLWDVDDEASRQLMIAFHREYRASGSPLGALRDAQLELLRGTDARLRHPASWASYLVVGGDPTLFSSAE